MTSKTESPEDQGRAAEKSERKFGEMKSYDSLIAKLLKAGLPLVDATLLGEHVSDENRKRIMQAKTLPEIREVMAVHAIEAAKSKKEYPHP